MDLEQRETSCWALHATCVAPIESIMQNWTPLTLDEIRKESIIVWTLSFFTSISSAFSFE